MLPTPATPAGGAAQGHRITGYQGPRRTVLVIDDDPAQAAMLGSVLRPLGFTLHAAAGGAEGIALAARVPADLVLLDIQMPGMSGWEVAERLRAVHGQALRIAMLSANAHELGAGADSRSHHDAFMTKPFELDALVAMIGNLLNLRWEEAAVVAPIDRPAPAARTPAEAAPFLERLRDLATIGHVRGMEDMLDELDAAVPAAAALASVLRCHLRGFDLRSFVQALDDAGR